jgi:hypothetical protein
LLALSFNACDVFVITTDRFRCRSIAIRMRHGL